MRRFVLFFLRATSERAALPPFARPSSSSPYSPSLKKERARGSRQLLVSEVRTCTALCWRREWNSNPTFWRNHFLRARRGARKNPRHDDVESEAAACHLFSVVFLRFSHQEMIALLLSSQLIVRKRRKRNARSTALSATPNRSSPFPRALGRKKGAENVHRFSSSPSFSQRAQRRIAALFSSFHSVDWRSLE